MRFSCRLPGCRRRRTGGCPIAKPPPPNWSKRPSSSGSSANGANAVIRAYTSAANGRKPGSSTAVLACPFDHDPGRWWRLPRTSGRTTLIADADDSDQGGGYRASGMVLLAQDQHARGHRVFQAATQFERLELCGIRELEHVSGALPAARPSAVASTAGSLSLSRQAMALARSASQLPTEGLAGEGTRDRTPSCEIKRGRRSASASTTVRPPGQRRQRRRARRRRWRAVRRSFRARPGRPDLDEGQRSSGLVVHRRSAGDAQAAGLVGEEAVAALVQGDQSRPCRFRLELVEQASASTSTAFQTSSGGWFGAVLLPPSGVLGCACSLELG